MKAPAFRAAIDGVFPDLEIAVVRILERNGNCGVGSDVDGLYGCITDPVGILHRNFLGIQGTRRQVTHSDG